MGSGFVKMESDAKSKSQLICKKEEHELGIRYFRDLIQEAENGNEEAIKYLDKIPDGVM